MSLRVGPGYDEDLLRLALDSYCTAAIITASLFLYLLKGERQEAFLQVLEQAEQSHKTWRGLYSERDAALS
jgi:hypothetical protein